ncbi:DNA-3-methyladenine glycosylase II [Oikeobacillus pervagus]|uniref:DNA-3-methyladenine glycosylase II n=1 Tax=Oikeobacillus pervagus TaxID=1325931 RepID=A0AAJ1T103_9BACI|nr:DNA-3-methyladenine glycosylase [Oikeobacillus pervagus]MDQ0216578.1 DNA-3-methyladenine glycosylase II [Oikeobacillus pervagus]
MWQEKIEKAGPYHFDQVLDRLSIDPLNQIFPDERMIHVPIYTLKEVAQIQAIGTVEEPIFIIKGENHQTKLVVLQEISKIFQWDMPLKPMITHFQETDMAEIVAEHYGTPIVLDFSPYSCIIKCIIHQQLNLKFAHTLTERFVKQFGEKRKGVWFYPTPEKAASITIPQLRDLQFSQRKAEYVIGFSELVANQQIDLTALANEPNEAILKKLTKVRGIGPWTVENFLMFGLGRKNLFPKQDIGIQRAIQQLKGLEHKPTFEQMEEWSKEWAPYLSYASLYLWRSIEKRK